VNADERIAQLTNQIVEKFRNSGFDVDAKEISKRLKLLILEFKVPESEAVRTITNYLMKELGISREQLARESPLVKISDITKPNQWVSLKAKVVQLWDASSPNVSQVGLIGDETGIIKFVIWAKSGKERLKRVRATCLRTLLQTRSEGECR